MKIIKRLPGLAIQRTLGVLSGRWKPVVLHALLDGPQRTHELESRIEDEWGVHHARQLDEAHRLLPCEAVVRKAPARRSAS